MTTRSAHPSRRVRTRRTLGHTSTAAVAAAFAALVCFAGSSNAAKAGSTQTLTASADTYLRSGAPDTNEGGAPFTMLRASGENRTLVSFSESQIQAAAGTGRLISATLTFPITQNSNNWGSTGRTVSVYRLTSPWSEGNGYVQGAQPPNRGTGAGATWNCATDANIATQATDCSGVTAWTMGKPSQPQLHPWVEPATSSALIQNGQTGALSFDVTPDVQAFLAGTAQNDGWIVKKDVEGDSGQVQFGSKEGGSPAQLVLTVASSADTTPPSAPANIGGRGYSRSVGTQAPT